MTKVRLSKNARIFIQREAKYLRERNQAAAESFLGRLRQARRNLAQFPRIGHEKTSLPIEGAMRLVVGDYILDYDLDDEGVAITAIRHGRQQDPDLDKDEDFDFEADTSRTTTIGQPGQRVGSSRNGDSSG
jgi:plasmid stabilization system protein ParE